MPVTSLRSHQPFASDALAAAERAMPLAPSVTLAPGLSVVPQHYRQYQQSLASLQQLLSEVALHTAQGVDKHTLFFADEDHAGLYVQVGLIGRENYERSHNLRPHKLVYGRKWRIDPDTPSAEVLQTAFLAAKLAHQHEIRELLTLDHPERGYTSTPMSTHQDFRLMAQHPELLRWETQTQAPTVEQAQAMLAPVRFAQRRIEVVAVWPRSQHVLVDVRLGPAPLARQQEGDWPACDNIQLTLLVTPFNRSALVHALLAALLQLVEQRVEEGFRYRGLARFSRSLDPWALGELSLATRPYGRDLGAGPFAAVFRQSNAQVDASRAPSLGHGPLADKNRALIAQHGDLLGYMPRGWIEADTRLRRQG